VRSSVELASVFDVLGAQFAPSFTRQDRRFADLARRYPDDRSLMLVAEREDGSVAGGALAFRSESGPPGPTQATLRLIAVVEAYRGTGLGRRLMQRLESEAVDLCVSTIYLGVGGDVREFYVKLGYSGRSRLHKTLPGSVVARYGQGDARRRALEELRSRRTSRLPASDRA